MKVAVISAIYGQYDELVSPPPQSVDAEWVCVTDDPELKSDFWRIELDRMNEIHPRLAAKIAKFMPWRYALADYYIWVDGSAQIVSERFVEEVIGQLGSDLLAQFIHPWRSCIYTEAQASAKMTKYLNLPIYRQVITYRREGHPSNWGLWATGLIARKHDPAMEKLAIRWYQECYLWTYQDQLSEPHILRQMGLRPVGFSYGLHSNPWMNWREHANDR